MFDDGTRPMTSGERRAYDAKVKQLREAGGAAAANAWIDEQHRLFLAAKAAYRATKRASR